jgi:hypothetical protein
MQLFDKCIVCVQFRMESRSLSNNQLHRSVTELRKFNARRKFKAVMKLVLAKARFERRLRTARSLVSTPVPSLGTDLSSPRGLGHGDSFATHSTLDVLAASDTVTEGIEASFSDKYTVLELLGNHPRGWGKNYKGKLDS